MVVVALEREEAIAQYLDFLRTRCLDTFAVDFQVGRYLNPACKWKAGFGLRASRCFLFLLCCRRRCMG